MVFYMQVQQNTIQGADIFSKGNHYGYVRKAKPRNTDLGRAVTAHREAAGMTLDQVAEQLNALAEKPTHSKNTVGRWERGERGISAANQRHLAKVFGITPAELSEPPRPANIHEILKGQPAEIWHLVADLAKRLSGPS